MSALRSDYIMEVVRNVRNALEKEIIGRGAEYRNNKFHGIILHPSGIMEAMINVREEVFNSIIGKSKYGPSVISFLDMTAYKDGKFDMISHPFSLEERKNVERFFKARLNGGTITDDMMRDEFEAYKRRFIVTKSYTILAKGYSHKLRLDKELGLISDSAESERIFKKTDSEVGILRSRVSRSSDDKDSQTTIVEMINRSGQHKFYTLGPDETESTLNNGCLAFGVLNCESLMVAGH